MTSILSLMVLLLANGTEDRTLMQSHVCRMDAITLRRIQSELPPGSSMVTTGGVRIVGFQCRPWKMEALG
jgi:hypothetical protein